MRRAIARTVVILVGVVVVGAGLSVLTGGAPKAQNAPAPGAPARSGRPLPSQPRDPFVLPKPDPGAIKYEELTNGPPPPGSGKMSKQSVDAVLRWASQDNGPSTHAAWSVYSAKMAEQARARKAEYEAGLAGAAERGAE